MFGEETIKVGHGVVTSVKRQPLLSSFRRPIRLSCHVDISQSFLQVFHQIFLYYLLDLLLPNQQRESLLHIFA